MALLVDGFYKQGYEERRLKDLKDRAQKLTARTSTCVPCSSAMLPLSVSVEGHLRCGGGLASNAVAACTVRSLETVLLPFGKWRMHDCGVVVQALLKCAIGVEEDVFPPVALERGWVCILNSLANFSVDAPQAPKLVRLPAFMGGRAWEHSYALRPCMWVRDTAPERSVSAPYRRERLPCPAPGRVVLRRQGPGCLAGGRGDWRAGGGGQAGPGPHGGGGARGG